MFREEFIDYFNDTVDMNNYSDTHIVEYYEGCERIIVNKGKEKE